MHPVAGQDRFRWLIAVIADPRLTAAQKNVATRLVLHFNGKTGRCFPSVARLAAGCAMTRQGVQKALGVLKDRGLVDYPDIRGRGHTRQYLLLMPPAAPPTVLAEGEKPPEVEIIPPENANGGLPFDEAATGHENANGETGKRQQPSQKTPTVVGPNLKENQKEENLKVYSCASIDLNFEEFYRNYPRREAKGPARTIYARIVRSGAALPIDLLHGAMQYRAVREGEDPKFTKLPAKWLEQECWKDEPPPKYYGSFAALAMAMRAGRRRSGVTAVCDGLIDELAERRPGPSVEELELEAHREREEREREEGRARQAAEMAEAAGARLVQWTRCLDRLRKEFGDKSVDRYFADAELDRLSSTAAVISVVAPHDAQKIKELFGKALLMAWQAEQPTIKELSVLIRSAPDRRSVA
jgi:hypothetical protein